MRITVDRPTRSNAAPAAVPPKGTAGPLLYANGRSAGRAGTYRSLTSGRVQPLNSPAAAGGRPKRRPIVAFSRAGEESRKEGFACMDTQARTHGQVVGVAIGAPTATVPCTRSPVGGAAIQVRPATPAPPDRRRPPGTAPDAPPASRRAARRARAAPLAAALRSAVASGCPFARPTRRRAVAPRGGGTAGPAIGAKRAASATASSRRRDTPFGQRG